MLTVAKKLRQEIAKKRTELELLEKQIAAIAKHCDHKWEEVEFAPIQIIRQWSRTCKICGHVQTTERTKDKEIPGTTSTYKIPAFAE